MRRRADIILFLGTIILLGWAVQRTWFSRTPGGEWQPKFIGLEVDTLQAISPSGDTVLVTHPSTILFVTPGCRFCRLAVAQLAQSIESVPWRSEPIILLKGSETDFRVLQEELRGTSVVPLRLLRGAPSLGFMRDTPLLLSMSSTGAVRTAFLGVPDGKVLREYTSQ